MTEHEPQGPNEPEDRGPDRPRPRRLRANMRIFAGITIAFTLLAGAVAALSDPDYESEFTLVPVDQADLIRNWFASRNASEIVAARYESQIAPVLFPDSWDATAGAWRGEPPSLSLQGDLLRRHLRLRLGSPETETGKDRFLQVIITFEDAGLARRVAEGYLGTLKDLRPILENITRQEAADRYYRDAFFQGSIEEATRRAEVYAKGRTFWIVLDTPTTAVRPAGPGALAIVGIGAVLGILVGALAIPVVERLQRARSTRF